MASSTPLATTLTIALNATLSNVLPILTGTHFLSIYPPATMPETVTLTALDPVTGAYKTVQSAGTDITLTANKVLVLVAAPFTSLQLVAGSAVAAARVFGVVVSTLP